MLIDLLVGLLFIVLGLLVVPFPILISGYNTMPKEEREKMNIYGFSRMMRFWLCVMGIVLMIGSYLLRFLDHVSWIPGLFLGVLIVGITIIKLNEKQFITGEIKKSRRSKVMTIIMIISIPLTIGFVCYTAYPAKITVNEKELIISGAYAITVPLESITEVECRDQLPATIMRSNGTSIGKYHKGNFMMDEIGASRLYLHSGKGPYLLIYSKGNKPILLDRSTPEEVTVLYEQLKISK